MEKETKKRKHILFDIPLLGPIMAAVLSMAIIGGIASTIAKAVDETTNTPVYYMILIAGSLAALLVHKLWFKGEFKGCINSNFGDKRTVSIILAAFAVCLICDIISLFFTGIQAPTLLTLTMAVTAGVFEETFFRGIPISVAMKNCNSKKGIVAVAVISSVIFGLGHVANLKGGADLTGTVVQILSSGCGGFFFGVSYIVTGNLLIPMIIHAVHDFIAFLADNVSSSGIVTSIGTADYILSAVNSIADLIFGILLLKTDPEKILALWRNLWSKD